MSKFKFLGILLSLSLIIFPFKEGRSHVKTIDGCEQLTFENSLKPEYTIVDTLGFKLEKEKDFISAFDLLSENQFLVTKLEENENYNVLIVEGSFLTKDLKFYCTYSSSNTRSNDDWFICLRGAIKIYKTSKQSGSCPYVYKKGNSLGIYNQRCAED